MVTTDDREALSVELSRAHDGNGGARVVVSMSDRLTWIMTVGYAEALRERLNEALTEYTNSRRVWALCVEPTCPYRALPGEPWCARHDPTRPAPVVRPA